jgi:hypothetical protein
MIRSSKPKKICSLCLVKDKNEENKGHIKTMMLKEKLKKEINI